MEITPSRKLFTKDVLILLTLTVLLLLIAVVLQLLIPLGKHVTAGQVADILWPITFAVVLLLWIISLPLVFYWIKNLKYEILQDRITIHKGILTKVQQNIPYRSITDFILHRSLYDRFLGLASIRVQTAGQSTTATGYEGNVAGLLNWEPLIQDLRERVKSVLTHLPDDTSAKNGMEDTLQNILEEVRVLRKLVGEKFGGDN